MPIIYGGLGLRLVVTDLRPFLFAQEIQSGMSEKPTNLGGPEPLFCAPLPITCFA